MTQLYVCVTWIIDKHKITYQLAAICKTRLFHYPPLPLQFFSFFPHNFWLVNDSSIGSDLFVTPDFFCPRISLPPHSTTFFFNFFSHYFLPRSGFSQRQLKVPMASPATICGTWPKSTALPVDGNFRSACSTVSTENATPPKSTKSRNSNFSVHIQIKPKLLHCSWVEILGALVVWGSGLCVACMCLRVCVCVCVRTYIHPSMKKL